MSTTWTWPPSRVILKNAQSRFSFDRVSSRHQYKSLHFDSSPPDLTRIALSLPRYTVWVIATAIVTVWLLMLTYFRCIEEHLSDYRCIRSALARLKENPEQSEVTPYDCLPFRLVNVEQGTIGVCVVANYRRACGL